METQNIAKLVGADSTITWKHNDKFFTVRTKKNGKWRSRKVRELTEAETNRLHPRGPASGVSAPHCAYITSRFWKDFYDRVCGYRLIPSISKDCAVSVIFYEKA